MPADELPVDELFQDFLLASLYDPFNGWDVCDASYLDLARGIGGARSWLRHGPSGAPHRQRRPRRHRQSVMWSARLKSTGLDRAFVRPPWRAIVPTMSKPPAEAYTVSGVHPDTRQFHGESCATLENAQKRVKELRAAGYQSVTLSPSDPRAPTWPRN